MSYFDVKNLWKLDDLFQVEAWDQDCSPQYSQICNYEIVTAGTPFAIDRNGKRHASVCVLEAGSTAGKNMTVVTV